MPPDRELPRQSQSLVNLVPRLKCQWSFETMDPQHPNPDKRSFVRCRSCEAIFVESAIHNRPCPNGCTGGNFKSMKLSTDASLKPTVVQTIVACSIDAGPYRTLEDEPLGISTGTIALSWLSSSTIQLRNNSDHHLQDLHLDLPPWISSRFFDAKPNHSDCGWLAVLPPKQSVSIEFKVHFLWPNAQLSYGRIIWTEPSFSDAPSKKLIGSRTLGFARESQFQGLGIFAVSAIAVSFTGCFLLGNASVGHLSLIGATWAVLVVLLSPGYVRRLTQFAGRLAGVSALPKDVDDFLLTLEFKETGWLLRACMFPIAFLLLACVGIVEYALLPTFSPTLAAFFVAGQRLLFFFLGLMWLQKWLADLDWNLYSNCRGILNRVLATSRPT